LKKAEHLKLIEKLKFACVTTHLAFLNADHTNSPTANDAYEKALSDCEIALAAYQLAFSKLPIIPNPKEIA
jgi:hypothetical protein